MSGAALENGLTCPWCKRKTTVLYRVYRGIQFNGSPCCESCGEMVRDQREALRKRLMGRPKKTSREIFEDFGVPTFKNDYE